MRVIHLLVFISLPQLALAAEPPSPILPTPEAWINHVQRDLMPFWLSPVAIGDPVGHFPTFRTRNGLSPHADSTSANQDTQQLWDRSYTSAISRQTFAYGVAFHLTGDPVYLNLAKAGTEHILQRMDPITGVASWVANGDQEPYWRQRTSQDLALALLGPAFVYYLTREEWLLVRIEDIIQFIDQHYADLGNGLIRWILEDFDDLGFKHRTETIRLESLLAQVESYLLLLASSGPRRQQAELQSRLQLMAIAMLVHFHDEDSNLFASELSRDNSASHEPLPQDLTTTLRAYWALAKIADHLEDPILSSWVGQRLPHILRSFWLESAGTWAIQDTAERNETNPYVWAWQVALGNNIAATLSLEDASWQAFLARSYRFWRQNLVDVRYGEVWAKTTIGGEPALEELKANQLFNGHHTLQHALIAYITSAFSTNRPVELYFSIATDPERHSLQAYVFDAEVVAIETLPRAGAADSIRQVITFTARP